MKKKIKKIWEKNPRGVVMSCIFLLAVSMFAGGYLYYETNRTKSYVCQSAIEYNQGIGIDFTIKQGKILSITKRDTVTREFIKNNLKDTDVNEAFITYKENAQKEVERMNEKYKSTYFATSFGSQEDEISTVYKVAVGADGFKYEDNVELLEELDLTSYYNHDKKTFVYDEGKILNDSPLSALPKVTCKRAK